jgi:GNAT superfamily N-acetyltransferase
MISVFAAEQEHRQAALRLMLSREIDVPDDARVADVMESTQLGKMNLDGLLAAKADDTIVGAALYVLQPDQTAFVWPPVVRGDADMPSISDDLLRELCHRIDAAGVWLGQSLVETGAIEDRAVLVRNGFDHLTDLQYLDCSLDGRGGRGESTPRLATVNFDPATNVDRFASLLETTYLESRDCPELNGTRTGKQALWSHEVSGGFDASRWKIYRVGATDVGVLLLNDRPDQNAWEVVYMGIVPAQRGKGYGREMLLCGLDEARQAGRASVLLAVDRNNSYAQSIYKKLGFVDLGTRAAHVRIRPENALDSI